MGKTGSGGEMKSSAWGHIKFDLDSECKSGVDCLLLQAKEAPMLKIEIVIRQNIDDTWSRETGHSQFHTVTPKEWVLIKKKV